MNKENGRSMIETLGVLAIMGVITIGGISGFRTVMNKFRINGITELVAALSQEAQRQNECIGLTDLDDEPENPPCIETMIGAPNGQVKIVFKAEDACADIKQIFGTSFGPCKLDIKSDYIVYVPTRSSQEDRAELCDRYTEYRWTDSRCP